MINPRLAAHTLRIKSFAGQELKPLGGAELFNEPRRLERRPEDHPAGSGIATPATEELVTPD